MQSQGVDELPKASASARFWQQGEHRQNGAQECGASPLVGVWDRGCELVLGLQAKAKAKSAYAALRWRVPDI